MNEIEREFNTDVKQKKSIARGAYARKNGSKSKKCSLPSDNLTPAQKRKLNGPVVSYAINQPMSWEAFKTMPTDLQQAHLDFIQNRFEVGLSSIEKHVFSVANATVRRYCASNGLHYKNARRVCSCYYQDLIAWASGIRSQAAIEPTERTEPSEGVVQNAVDPVPEVAEPAKPARDTSLAGLELLPDLFCGGKLCLSGKAEEVIPNLLTLIGSNEAWLSVHLSFTRKDD